MDYVISRAGELPRFDAAMTNTPCPSNLLGTSGCGEAGAIAAHTALIQFASRFAGSFANALPA
jgi:carbon-monoxide dehydrogenase large subunit